MYIHIIDVCPTHIFCLRTSRGLDDKKNIGRRETDTLADSGHRPKVECRRAIEHRVAGSSHARPWRRRTFRTNSELSPESPTM
jgi:hypothetical protein